MAQPSKWLVLADSLRASDMTNQVYYIVRDASGGALFLVHGDRANALFVDCHVSPVSGEDALREDYVVKYFNRHKALMP
jgi:prepilin-type processing-associated H-X9-DG protein